MNAVSSRRIVTDEAPSSARGRKGGSNPIDIHVGSRVRIRRTLLGMSQEKLGEAIGLTFQQVQKYERGANRIGASRLFDLSRVLDVPVSFFFDDMPATVATAKVEDADDDLAPVGCNEPDPMTSRASLEMMRDFHAIPDPAVRKQIAATIKAIARSGGERSAA